MASALAPMRHGTYRALWLAQFAGNAGTWAQTVGAQWLIGDLGGGPFEMALVQVATTLPVFLLVVPAGALGDILDRRRLLLTGQGLMFCGAAGLALLAASGVAGPASVLGLIAGMAVGQALSQPSFQAIQPELVPMEEIPQAALLNGANANIGRVVGPTIGGVLIADAGPAASFALNAVCFLGVLLVLLKWRRPVEHRPLGAEHVLAAVKAGARYVRDAPRFAAVLLRSTLFMVFASALWALLPAIARGPLGLDARGYGLVLAALGLGAALGTVLVARVRQRLGASFIVTLFSVAYAVSMLVVGLGTQTLLVVTMLVVAGMSWVAVQSTFSACAQVLLPDWTRARGLAYTQLVFMGGQAFGALGWGVLADVTSLSAAVVVPSAGLLAATLAGRRLLSLPDREIDMAPALFWPQPVGAVDPGHTAGPVLVTVDWSVRPGLADEFVAAMQEVGRSRRRTGAMMWGLFQDISAPSVFVETFVVSTWQEHLRQHFERGTVLDQRLEDRARRLLVPGAAPRVRHLIWASHPGAWRRTAPARPGSRGGG